MSPAFFQEREKTAAKWKSSHAEAFLIPAKPRTLTHSLHPAHRPSLPLRLYSLISCAAAAAAMGVVMWCAVPCAS